MRVFAALGLVAALLLCGCQPTTDIIGGRDPEKPVTRIVSLSPNLTEVLGMGEIEMLVGRTSSCNYPELVKEEPVVCDVKPHYEKIAALRPDLIVYDKALFNETDVAKLNQLGIRTEGYEVNSLDQYIEMMYRLGRSQPDPMRYSELVDRIQQLRANATVRPEAERPLVAVLMGGPGEYMIAGLGTFQADLVRQAAGRPVGPDAKQWVQANVESLVKENPDILIVSGDPAPILSDPRLASVRAVQARQVYGANPDVLLRAGWRVDQLLRRFVELFAGKRAGA